MYLFVFLLIWTRIIFHGCRDLQTLIELSLPTLQEITRKLNWDLVTVFPQLTSLTVVTEAAYTLNPMKCKGFAVTDGSLKRIKVESFLDKMLRSLNPIETGPVPEVNKRIQATNVLYWKFYWRSMFPL
jgi:hypothetical protein